MKRPPYVLSLIFAMLLLAPAYSADTMNLKSSIDIAMNNSPSMIEASEKLRAADARLGQAFGAILPNLSVSGNIGNAYQQPYQVEFGAMSAEAGTDETAYTSGYTFTLTQPLFMGGKLLSALDIAKASYNSEKENYRAAQRGLSYDVLYSYYGVLRAQKLSDLAEEALALAKAHLAQVKAMYSAGITTKADVLRSDVQVSNSEQDYTKAKNGFELAKNSFNNTLGRGLDEPVEIAEREFTSDSVSIDAYSDLVILAMKSRPEWLSFEYSKLISEKSVNIAYGNYWPNIMLVGTSGNAKRDYPTYVDTDQNSWTAMAQANWTLFDGLATPAKVDEADANHKAMLANEIKVKNNILLDIKNANLTLSSATDVLTSAKKEVASAVENYSIAEQKYKNGVGSNLEVIDAQVARTRAKTDLYQAQFDLQIAKAKLNKAIGIDIYKLY
jgi:outer membrane protein TolC